MKCALFALIFAVLASAALASPQSLPPPNLVPDGFGVNIHFTGAPARDLDGLQSAGFRWARMDFAWDAVEKTKGVYDFAAYDTLVAGLKARHIKPLFILDYGNDLYQKGAPRTPEARAGFARFAAAAVRHYKGKPILWEIWNEPNGGFWQPRANADEYAALAVETAQAIRAADPNATVIAPGTSGLPLSFMETAFKQGLLKYIDAVSFHPYRGDAPETAAKDYADVRHLVARYAPGRDVPLVSSEWGYTTVNVSEQTQAQYLARQWLSNLAEGSRVSIWYDWHDDGTDPKNGEHHFGTVHNDYAPKPAFVAAQTLTHALAGFTFVKRLSLPSDKDYLLLLRRGQSVRLAAWTTGDAHTITLPLAGPVALNGSPQIVQPSSQSTAALRHAADWTMQAQNPVYGQGQPPELVLTYANRDAKAHRVSFTSAIILPDGRPFGPVQLPSMRAAPGQTLHLPTVVLPLARISARARVSLVLDGVRQPFSQEVAFTPSDPLELSVAPQGKGFLVQIESPGGPAFRGRLTSLPPGKAVAITLPAGQTYAPMLVPGDPNQLTGWTLRDQSGQIVSLLPPSRFAPVPVDWNALATHLDGDFTVPSEIHPTVASDSLEIDYEFAPGWTFLQSDLPNAAPVEGKPAALGLWVQGDDSGNLIRMRFRDATGQTFQPGGRLIDWTGWRWVTFPMQAGTDLGHWAGANDGAIHYPIALTTLFLLDSPGEAKRHQGTVAFKQPSWIYAK